MTTVEYAPAKESIRLVRGGLSYAERCEPAFSKARTTNKSVAQANGIRYERKVHRALAVLAKYVGAVVEHNPWFKFVDINGIGICSPDAILWMEPALALVIEIKYTWIPTAGVKLRGLYIPVVNAALKPAILRSLIICKNLTPQSPQPIESICEGTQFSVNNSPVYQWLGQGPLIW